MKWLPFTVTSRWLDQLRQNSRCSLLMATGLPEVVSSLLQTTAKYLCLGESHACRETSRQRRGRGSSRIVAVISQEEIESGRPPAGVEPVEPAHDGGRNPAGIQASQGLVHAFERGLFRLEPDAPPYLEPSPHPES